MPYTNAVREHAQLFDVPGHAVIATTPEGEIVYWSDHATRIFGWSRDEVMGMPVTSVTPASASEAEASAIMALLQEGKPWSGMFRLRHRNGHEFTARVSDLPVIDDEGTLVGIVGVTLVTDESFFRRVAAG
jgi:PAS domain S-box-containing protein